MKESTIEDDSKNDQLGGMFDIVDIQGEGKDYDPNLYEDPSVSAEWDENLDDSTSEVNTKDLEEFLG